MKMKIPPSYSFTCFNMRVLTSGDAVELHSILSDPEVIRYMPFKSAPSLERVQKIIQDHIDHWAKFRYGWWALESKPEAKFIGWCGLEYLPELDETEVGYLLEKSAWGKGIASLAVKASLDFAFKSAGLNKVIGLVHPENTASLRVLEKNGLRKVDELELWGMQLIRLQDVKP